MTNQEITKLIRQELSDIDNIGDICIMETHNNGLKGLEISIWTDTRPVWDNSIIELFSLDRKPTEEELKAITSAILINYENNIEIIDVDELIDSFNTINKKTT